MEHKFPALEATQQAITSIKEKFVKVALFKRSDHTDAIFQASNAADSRVRAALQLQTDYSREPLAPCFRQLQQKNSRNISFDAVASFTAVWTSVRGSLI